MFDPAEAACGSQGTASSPSSVPAHVVVSLTGPAPYVSESGPRTVGGDERDRTADLCLAKAALSQLSYIPTCLETASKLLVAEREGFEPSVRSSRTRDFQSRTLDHSVTSPLVSAWRWGWDSNPRYPEGTTVFETATIDQLRHPTVVLEPSGCYVFPLARRSWKKLDRRAEHSSARTPDVTATL